MSESTKFNLASIFVGMTETPGPNRLAVARLHKKNDKGEDLYQIINRSMNNESRSEPLNAEQVMVSLLTVIDNGIFRTPNDMFTQKRNPKS